MSPRYLIPFCGVMLSLNAISCDMLLPALFALEARLGADRASIQAILPVYLMAAALGQIVFGPLSDRYGRKPILQLGIACYLAGSFAGLIAPTLPFLYGARMLQGFGAACMVVLARAILRDSFNGNELGRAMALASAIFTVGPMFAPLLGVIALEAGGWRGPFIGMIVIALALYAFILLTFRETNLSPDPRATAPDRMLAAAGTLFANRQSRHFLGVLVVAQVVVVTFVSTAPQMFRSAFGVEGFRFAILFSTAACGIVVGQLINSRLIPRCGVLTVTRWTATLMAFVALATVVMAEQVNLRGFVFLLFLFNLSFLVVVVNSMTLVMEPHRSIAGTAAAILGCVQQLLGSIFALLLLQRLDGSAGMWAAAHVTLVVLVAALVRGYRAVAPEPVAGPVPVPAE